VKGFAVTLIVGLAASMFTANLVKTIFMLEYGARERRKRFDLAGTTGRNDGTVQRPHIGFSGSSGSALVSRGR
jgi:hypothetical protein